MLVDCYTLCYISIHIKWDVFARQTVNSWLFFPVILLPLNGGEDYGVYRYFQQYFRYIVQVSFIFVKNREDNRLAASH